jgi:hypothetical protein
MWVKKLEIDLWTIHPLFVEGQVAAQATADPKTSGKKLKSSV